MSQELFDVSGDAKIIREKLEALDALRERYRLALEALEGPPKVYANKRIKEAVEMYLQQVGSAPEEEIFKAMVEGGLDLGVREPLGHLRRSLTQSVNAGRIRTTKDGKYELGKR